MTGHKIRIPGFRIGKNGKPVPDERRLDLSTRLKRRASRKIRVIKR